MSRGSRGEPDDEDESAPILTPEELDISDHDNVTEIDEDRYVISADRSLRGEMDASTSAAHESDRVSFDFPEAGDEGDGRDDSASAGSDDSSEEVMRAGADHGLAGVNARYGFDIAAKFEDEVRSHQLLSNDIVTVFETLLLWYAQHGGDGTAVDEVLGILLMESKVPVRYPIESLYELLSGYGLGPDDSVADLIAAAKREGFVFPARSRKRRGP